MRDIYRIFGSPFSAAFHQHLTYLHLKRLPTKVYCTTFASTKVYSMYFRCKTSFCALTPERQSCILLWQLLEAVEASEGGNVAARKILLDRRTHPQLHLLSWVIMAYSSWWLTLTGATFRWVNSDASTIVNGYMNYFLMLNGLGTNVKIFREQFRKMMCGLGALHGVCDESRQYMVEHFDKMCQALEVHMKTLARNEQRRIQLVNLQKRKDSPPSDMEVVDDAEQSVGAASVKAELFETGPYRRTVRKQDPSSTRDKVERWMDGIYLLGTPHPTLADVAVASAFSGYFLIDDPPSSEINSKYPYLAAYTRKVCGFPNLVNGELKPLPPTDATEDRENGAFRDTVPPSLAPFLLLIEEVLPFLVAQCESFHDYMTSDDMLKLKKATVVLGEGTPSATSVEGFELPQRTDIRTVMIIDKSILTVFARAQDLEVASVAAREVLDKDLGPFNKLLPLDEPPASPIDDTVAATKEDLSREPPVVDNGNSCASLTPEIEGATTSAPVADVVSDRLPSIDNADVHHVFSSKTRRFQPPAPRATSDIVQSLERMLRKMHTPQFTLTAVSDKKRVFVAVIPEHEYAKKRNKDAAAAKERSAADRQAS